MPRDLQPGATPFAEIRTLPLGVRPVDGETSHSYLLRLAAANTLAPETVWSHLRALHKKLPYKCNAQLATKELEALGGLPENWFTNNRQRHLLPLRCHHKNWKLSTCPHCSRVPAAQSGCLRCSHGERTQVTTLTGPICLRHQRWHYQDADLDLSQRPDYLFAERRLRHELCGRGVSLETGEIQLSFTLLKGWKPSVDHSDPIRLEDSVDADADGVSTPANLSFQMLFPAIVELTCTLTDPQFTKLLLSPQWSPSEHAYLLSTAIADIAGRPLPDETVDALWETVRVSRRAVHAAYAMTGQRRRSRKCSTQRAFCAAAYTHRACLLRHLDAKDMPSTLITTSGPIAPPPRSVVRYQQA